MMGIICRIRRSLVQFQQVSLFQINQKVRFIIWSPPQGRFAFLGRLTKQKTELTAVDQEVNISKLGWDDGQVRTTQVVVLTL